MSRIVLAIAFALLLGFAGPTLDAPKDLQAEAIRDFILVLIGVGFLFWLLDALRLAWLHVKDLLDAYDTVDGMHPRDDSGGDR